MVNDYDRLYKKERMDRYAIKNCVIPPNVDNISNTGKVQTKHPNPAGGIGRFFIQPLDTKKKRRGLNSSGQLNDEDLADIRREYGSTGLSTSKTP